MEKHKIGSTDTDLEEGEILDDDRIETVKSNVLKQVGTSKVLAKDNVKKNSSLNDNSRSVAERPVAQDYGFGVTGLPSKIGKSILEKAMFRIIGVKRNMVLQFVEEGKTLWIYFRNLETMMLVLKTVLHKKMGQYKLNVEVVQCRNGKMDVASHEVLTQLNFTDKVIAYVHTSNFCKSSYISVVQYRQNHQSKRKDNQTLTRNSSTRKGSSSRYERNSRLDTSRKQTKVQHNTKESENWDFNPSTRARDQPSSVKQSLIRTPSLQNLQKKKEKQYVTSSSGSPSTCSVTSDTRCSPVSTSKPSLPQVDSKSTLRDGCTCCDFDYEVYHLVDFMDQTYNQQIHLKTTHVLRMLDKIETRLLATCVNLEQYIHKKQQENSGLFCTVNSFLECPPNQNSTFVCTFEGGKEEESGVYDLGFRLRSCRVRKLSHVRHNYPDHVLEAAKVIVKMGSSKLWRDVIIYTNRAKKLMLQFVLESDKNENQNILEYNLIDFFAKEDGKCCNVASIYIKIPGKLQSKLVWGTAYLEESLGGMKILLLPTDPLWSDFRAAEMMCKVVEQLMAPTRNTTVLEMGCGNGLIGLFLSKTAGQVLSMDYCNHNIRVANRNAENIKVKNCVYFDGNTLTVLSQVSKLICYESVCALVLNKLSPPVADTMMELRKIKHLNKVVLLMEIDTVSKFVLPLSITDNTEELGNPLFITKVVPIDTLPNTKKYLVVILMERINLCDIEKMKSCSGSFKTVKKKHRCFGLGNKCKVVNNCHNTYIDLQQNKNTYRDMQQNKNTSRDMQQNKVIGSKNICEKQVVLKEKHWPKKINLLLANKKKASINEKSSSKREELLLANKQKALVNEILQVNKQKDLANEKNCSNGRDLFLMIKQNTVFEKQGRLDSAVEQNEQAESEPNISGVETGDELTCEDEETTKLRIVVEEQRKLIAEEQNKFLIEINQEQKRLLTEEVQKKFQDRSEERKLKAEEELRKIFMLVEQKEKKLQTEEENEVFETEQRRPNTEKEQNVLQLEEEQRLLQAEEEKRQKAEDEQKEIEAWKKRMDAELKKHEEWSRLRSEKDQRHYENRRKALKREWDKKRKRKEAVMPERKKRREEGEIECNRSKRESWKTHRKKEHKRDGVDTNDDKNKPKNDDSDTQKILVKETLKKLMSLINEGGCTTENKESSTKTCLDNTAGPSHASTSSSSFGNALGKLKDIMKAVIETSETLVEDNTDLKP